MREVLQIHEGFHHSLYKDTVQNKLGQLAHDVEASFLAEMMMAAGLGQPPAGFDGGIGEEHFISVLARKQSEYLVARSGLGLAEAIVQAKLGTSGSS